MKKEAVISNYENYNEDKRAYGPRSEQSEFFYTKKLLDKFMRPDMSVVELGCGTGYYGLYLSDKCKSYYGVDLTPVNIEKFSLKIKEQKLSNLSAAIGDATNLSEIENDAYDAVLVMGPMYHLPRELRQKVILESMRICKSGGIIMFAYINKIGAYLRACIDKGVKARYPNKKTNEFVLNKGTDDMKPDVFFYTMPEEIEYDVMVNGLEVIENAGVHFCFDAEDIDNMDDEKYAAWTEITDLMFKSKSCTGVSGHAVLVCRN